MAVNTFLKIAETCKEEFVTVHAKKDDYASRTHFQEVENVPYIDELLKKINEETALLEPEHKFVFYSELWVFLKI